MTVQTHREPQPSGLAESLGQTLPIIAARVLTKVRTQALLLDALRREPSKARRAPLSRLYALLVETERLA